MTMRSELRGAVPALLGAGLAFAASCAVLPHGTVRLQNATVATPICKIQIGYQATTKNYEQRIEPGGFADFAATMPPPDRSQQPVKMQPCGGGTYMVQNIEFSQGKQHMVVVYDGAEPPAVETPPGFKRWDQRSSRDASTLVNLPNWQNEKGMKENWVFFSLRSKCDHRVDYKFTPSTAAPQGINPNPKTGYKFWIDDGAYREVSTFSKEPITLWVRDRSKTGSGDWMESIKIDPGKSARLEVDQSCTKVVERTDDERYHGCYEWVYSPSCKLPARISKQPPGCPEGTPSVEGDMSKTCEIKTPLGLCTVRYAKMGAGCDVR
jgi:hypothetical protein